MLWSFVLRAAFPRTKASQFIETPCLFTPSHLLPHTPPFTIPLELLLFVQRQILLSRLISIRYAGVDCLQAHRCATYTQRSPKSEEGFRCSGTGGPDSCEPTCGRQETNSHPLQRQQVPLITIISPSTNCSSESKQLHKSDGKGKL